MTFKLFEVEFGTSQAPDLGILQAGMASSRWIRAKGIPIPERALQAEFDDHQDYDPKF